MWNHHRTHPGRPPRRPRGRHRSSAALHALHQGDVLHLQRPAEHHPLQGNPSLLNKHAFSPSGAAEGRFFRIISGLAAASCYELLLLGEKSSFESRSKKEKHRLTWSREVLALFSEVFSPNQLFTFLILYPHWHLIRIIFFKTTPEFDSASDGLNRNWVWGSLFKSGFPAAPLGRAGTVSRWTEN